MSSLVFHWEGAHPWKCKIVTLSEELRRRLLHIDSRHKLKDKIEILEYYIQKMCHSGYSHSTRMQVMKSTTKKY